MKKKMIIAIDVLVALGIIVCVVFWAVIKSNAEKCKKDISNLNQEIIQLNESQKEKADRISTPDEIIRLKTEINNTINEQDDKQAEIKQLVFNYIDCVYNTEGDFLKNKNTILNNASQYVTEGFKKYTLEKMFTVTKYSNFDLISKTKRLPNLCTSNDIFISVQKDENGKNMYYAFCILRFEYNTQYRNIVVDDINGKFQISADEKLYRNKK